MKNKKIFLIVGHLSVISAKVVYTTIRESFSSVKCVFVSKEGFLKSRFDYADATGKKIEAIFVGPVPHKTFAAGKQTSMVSVVNVANAITPVYVCRSKNGELKFTKTSIRSAVKVHLEYLECIRQQKIREDQLNREFIDLIKELFPNQRVFGSLIIVYTLYK